MMLLYSWERNSRYFTRWFQALECEKRYFIILFSNVLLEMIATIAFLNALPYIGRGHFLTWSAAGKSENYIPYSVGWRIKCLAWNSNDRRCKRKVMVNWSHLILWERKNSSSAGSGKEWNDFDFSSEAGGRGGGAGEGASRWFLFAEELCIEYIENVVVCHKLMSKISVNMIRWRWVLWRSLVFLRVSGSAFSKPIWHSLKRNLMQPFPFIVFHVRPSESRNRTKRKW